MIYSFENIVVNNSNVNNFYSKSNFVGYLLPNGDIYQCKEHNVSNIYTVLTMDLELLKNHFEDKEKILKNSSSDKLLDLVIKYLNNCTYEKIVALSDFIRHNSLFISDLLVQLFGCHLVTRLNRTILTSEIKHDCFYNYLLNDFSIVTIDKIVFDSDKEKYLFIKGINRNEYLYDEIKNIKENVSDNDIDLFYKSR